ncbi:MAG: CHAT domain-containing protein [Actinomycetota bacterium]
MPTFVTIEAGSTPAAASGLLAHSDAARVLVRRPGVPVVWTVAESSTVRDRLLARSDAATVHAALDGVVETATAVTLDELVGLESSSGPWVVLEDGEPIAVLDRDEPVPPELIPAPAPPVRAARRSAALAPAPPVLFSADARIDGPGKVAVGEEFALRLTVARSSLPGSGDLHLPVAADATSIDIDVMLVSPVFEPAEGAPGGRLSIDPRSSDEAVLELRLVAATLPPEAVSLAEQGLLPFWPTELSLLLVHNGTQSVTIRHTVVIDTGHAGPAPPTDPTPEPAAPAVTLTMPDLPSPDLTIVITAGGDPSDAAAGRFEARLLSPHGTAPPTRFRLELGTSAAAYVAAIGREVINADNKVDAFRTLAGVGESLAEQLDPAFWDAVNASLAAGRAASGEAPTVLLRTSDPSIPWELAWLDDRPGDPDAHPFLGSQTRLGRWPLHPRRDVPLPTDLDLEVTHLSAIIGVYKKRFPKLEWAEAEGEWLRDRYGARFEVAEREAIHDLLHGRRRTPSKLLHFACHGRSEGGVASIVTVDDSEITESTFRRSTAVEKHRPFVFLNACRGGATGEHLSQYGGFASSFVRSGCTGFIGPLWDVNDTVAHEIATSFYDLASEGVGPAEIMRRVRNRLVADAPARITYLAYVYYGHPSATLSGLSGSGR